MTIESFSIPRSLSGSVDNTTIEVSSGVIQIKDGSIGTTQIEDGAVTTAKVDSGFSYVLDAFWLSSTARSLYDDYNSSLDTNKWTDTNSSATEDNDKISVVAVTGTDGELLTDALASNMHTHTFIVANIQSGGTSKALTVYGGNATDGWTQIKQLTWGNVGGGYDLDIFIVANGSNSYDCYCNGRLMNDNLEKANGMQLKINLTTDDEEGTTLFDIYDVYQSTTI